MTSNRDTLPKSYLYTKLCSYDNLEKAYKKARKHKTLKKYVIDFEKNLKENLLTLRTELLFHSYRPKPLTRFIVRDPKTRIISKSEFRDRIIHHAICNIIEPIFDKTFICDSYANRIGKGTLKAIERFEFFRRKVTRNYKIECYVLKADIKHYFDTVNHELLIDILRKKIKDDKIIWLIKLILKNHRTKISGKGMPLGNLTSQFFANVYLNELDYYVKHELKVKYYIRYVDDFVILENSTRNLHYYKERINEFLTNKLDLELHPDKSKVISIKKGAGFLGFRIFEHHKLLKKSNIKKFKRKLSTYENKYDLKEIDYDKIYDFLEGWTVYVKHANTYKFRKQILTNLQSKFMGEISTKELNRYSKRNKCITFSEMVL